MNKYTIEGGINFYEELYKLLDIEESEEKTEEDNKLCLITNNQLSDKFVTLDCGHKFNYIPLFLDIKNHKQKFNGMEGSSSRLNNDEIRCPYCRSKHKGVLPYYEEFGFIKINGVNSYNPYSNVAKSYHNKCQYEIPNPNYDDTIEELTVNKKMIHCPCYHANKICMYNEDNPETPVTYGDDKYYCWKHHKVMIKKYKQEIKDKEKCELNKAKLIAKEEVKKAKEEEKQKLKEEKQKLKEEKQIKSNKKQNSDTDNVVLGPTFLTDSSGNEVSLTCIQILKSGPNKGTQCECKVYYENLCKRHCNIQIDI